MELMELLPFAVHYSGSVFVVGFVFGVIRNMWAIKYFGEANAIMAEIPLMLIASWIAWNKIATGIEKTYVAICEGDFCRREKRRLKYEEVTTIGMISFLYLMIYEFALGKIIAGETIRSFLSKQITFPHWIGLLGQLGFAFIPIIRYFLFPSRNIKTD